MHYSHWWKTCEAVRFKILKISFYPEGNEGKWVVITSNYTAIFFKADHAIVSKTGFC